MAGTAIGIVDTIVGPIIAPIDPWIWPCLHDTGAWEPMVGDLVHLILEPGDTVINVGAHVGYYTRMAALAVGATGFVYAYEPAPSNRRLLGLNTADLGNVTIRPSAVADVPSLGTLALSATNPGDHRLGAHTDATTAVPVDVVRLDDEPFERLPGLIITDAQGFDLKILRGARRLINTARPHLLVEWTPNLLDHADYPVVDELIADGYTATLVEASLPITCAADGDIIGEGTATLHLAPT